MDDNWDERVTFFVRECSEQLYKVGSAKNNFLRQDSLHVAISSARQNPVINEWPKDFNFMNFVKCIHTLSKCFQQLYLEYNKENRMEIESKMKELPFQCPLDAFNWLEKEIPLRHSTTENTKIYVWDTKGERSLQLEGKCKENMTDKDIIQLVKESL
jgi:hypothetical protein